MLLPDGSCAHQASNNNNHLYYIPNSLYENVSEKTLISIYLISICMIALGLFNRSRATLKCALTYLWRRNVKGHIHAAIRTHRSTHTRTYTHKQAHTYTHIQAHTHAHTPLSPRVQAVARSGPLLTVTWWSHSPALRQCRPVHNLWLVQKPGMDFQ